MISLSEHETILAVYAEKCDGPGWSNRLYWVVIRDGMTGKIRQEGIQPSEWGEDPDLAMLFPWIVLAHKEAVGAVERWMGKEKA